MLNKNYNKTNNDHLTKLKSDSEVKVIVKSVALDCCSSIIALCPYILFKPLKKRNQSEEDEETTCSIYIYDLINYVHHSDDKMRTTTCQLIGQLISSVLAETNGGSYNQWLLKMLKKSRHNDTEDENAELVRVGQFLRMESLVNHLLTFARSDNPSVSNNMCKRFALSSMHAFLPSLFKTRHASLALDILTSLVHLKNSAYNLVKSELVDLIASIDFKAVVYVENSMAAATALASQRRRKRSFGDNSSIKNNNSDYESNSDEDDENNSDDSSNSDEDDDYEAANQRFCPLLLRHTQERLVTDVYLHLLSTEDAKLRLETARCLTRFIANMSMNGGCASANQNVLMAVGESSLKSHGYSLNLLNASLVDTDLFNLNAANAAAKASSNEINANNPNASSSLSSLSSFLAPTSLLHGGQNPKKPIRYASSPLHSLTMSSSLPWLSKSVLNNTFVAPFHSLVKHWPSNASTSHTIDTCVNKVFHFF